MCGICKESIKSLANGRLSPIRGSLATLRPRQDGRHVADFYISNIISSKYVP